MTLEEATKKIAENWETFTAVKDRWDIDEGKIGILDDLYAVWIKKTDHAGSYEVDEEWIGVTEGGKIAWAYASGCSCWDGDYAVERLTPTTIKAFTFRHEDMKAEWEKAIIDFAEKL